MQLPRSPLPALKGLRERLVKTLFFLSHFTGCEELLRNILMCSSRVLAKGSIRVMLYLVCKNFIRMYKVYWAKLTTVAEEQNLNCSQLCGF